MCVSPVRLEAFNSEQPLQLAQPETRAFNFVMRFLSVTATVHARSAGGTELVVRWLPCLGLAGPPRLVAAGWLAGPHTGAWARAQSAAARWLSPPPRRGLRRVGVGLVVGVPRQPASPGTPQLSRPRPVGAAARTPRPGRTHHPHPPCSCTASPGAGGPCHCCFRRITGLAPVHTRQQGHACGSRHADVWPHVYMTSRRLRCKPCMEHRQMIIG